jgi:hypothetical protein
MQRLLDISPCFGTPASFGSFSSSDVDIYTNNLESFNAIRESYAKTTPAYYDSHYGFKSTFRFDAYHNGVAISINVIAPAVNKSVDTCIRGYDLSYLAISFTSGLFLYLTKIGSITVFYPVSVITGLLLNGKTARTKARRSKCK